MKTRIALLVVLAAAAGGAAYAQPGAAPTSLRITLKPDERKPESRTWTLTCNPVGGTLPGRAAACRRLAAAGRAAFAPVPRDAVCTKIYGGPQVGRVAGRLEGRKLWATFRRRNGCEITRWNRVSFLFPSVRSAAGRSLRVAVVGDFGVGGTAQLATGNAVRRYHESRPLDVLVTTGDNNYASPRSFAANWERSFGWLSAANVRVAGSIGNHDVDHGDPSYEFGALGMPSRYYTRRIGDVELFVLDSNDVSETQTAWLERALAASTAPWRIAVFHHPLHTCGVYRGQTGRVAPWARALARVQLVLNGHDHNYQRFAGKPVAVVEGGGGARLYELGACSPGAPPTAASRVSHGFLVLDVGTASATGQRLELDGTVVDRFTLPRQ